MVPTHLLLNLCLFANIAMSSPMGGGKCETTADCVAPNVCSKWGWCQWTKIYGEEGPSQGADAPGAGRAGQCRTSADCASRVPYCSKLGYCHGGRLPFDEAQLEITGDEEAQGFINNNPPKNSPILRNGNQRKATNSNNGSDSTRENSSPRKGENRKNGQPKNSSNQGQRSASKSAGGQACPGGSVETCIEQACVPLENVNVYGVCASACGQRCQ